MFRVKGILHAVVVSLFFLSLSSSAVTQVAPPSVYKNLVGDWFGYDDYVKDGQPKHVPVKISVKFEKNGKSVRMDYVYASKGDPDFTKYTKFLEIDTKTSTISFHWKHENADRYKVDSLDDFAQTGLGKISAIGSAAPGPHKPGDGSTGRFSLELGVDKLNYTWESKPASYDFKIVSVHTLNRSAVLPGSH